MVRRPVGWSPGTGAILGPLRTDGARALVRDHFNRRVEWGVEASRIERRRLLQWILAWTGLSTAWMLEDLEGRSEGLESRLDVGKLAAAALGIVD